VLVVRPIYRIDSCTIRSNSRVSNLIVPFEESLYLCDTRIPKEHVAYIPLVYSWSKRPMDSKFQKPKEDEDVQIRKAELV
jgi:hypothetical protein